MIPHDLPSIGAVREAAERIAPYVHRTPVFTSRTLDTMAGAELVFKAENLQKVGAFKARGAVNAVLQLSNSEAARGVVTHSSGNHGQAVAYACSLRSTSATVVMPHDAPEVKRAATESYGARIVGCAQPDRVSAVARLVDEHGYTVVHPFDDADVIAGQGTVMAEIVDQAPLLDVVVAPIGGGGLLSGLSLIAAEHGIDVVGAEPELVDDAYRSLLSGIRQPATGVPSVADGLLAGLGELPFALLTTSGASIVTVAENEIIDARRMIAERLKLVVEPSAATGLAAILRYREQFHGKRVGVILTGGNVDSPT